MTEYLFVKEARNLFESFFSSDFNYPRLYIPGKCVLGHFLEDVLTSRPVGEQVIVPPLLYDDSEKILRQCRNMLESQDLLVIESGIIQEKDLTALIKIIEAYQTAEKKAVEQAVKTINSMIQQ